MTCCIGKARIYYREPIGFKLIYSGSANGEVIAQETLTTTCVPVPLQLGSLYRIDYIYTATATACASGNILQETSSGQIVNLPPPVLMYTESSDGVCPSRGPYFTLYYSCGQPQTKTPIYMQVGTGPFQRTDIDFSYSASRMDGEEDSYNYTFKVIGTETGTVYREIGGLDECPAVENLGCVMGEEKYIDVEMGIGLPLLPSMIPDCLIAFSGFPLPANTIQIRKIRVNAPNTKPGKVKLPEAVLTITGLPDCPAEFRIICCPDGNCDPKERCPPDTDCSLDCGSFICCYKNGQVIRTIRK